MIQVNYTGGIDMSYAVVHMKKLSSPVIKGVQFHHQREKESKTNHDIDYDKSHMNYDIINSKPINFNQEVNSIIKENVVTNRAIRKDAVVLCDFIITSDKQFFKNLSVNKQKEFFEKSCEFFKDKYGTNKIVYAKVHLDESTPHMHLGLVPITEQCKLSAKSLFSRTGLRELQDQYPKFIQAHGFDLQRGEPKESQKHTETIDFKKQQAKELNQELNNVINGVKINLEKLSSFDDIKLDRVKIPLLKGKIMVSEGQYNENISIGKVGMSYFIENESLKTENKKLKTKNDNVTQNKINKVTAELNKEMDRVRAKQQIMLLEHEKLIDENKKYKITYTQNKEINLKLHRNISGLKKDNDVLSKKIKALDKTLGKCPEDIRTQIMKNYQKELRSLSKPKEISLER